MRSRVSIFGLLPLLSIVAWGAQVAAQDSPEFGAETELEAEASLTADAPAMDGSTDGSATANDAERSEGEQGYSSGAPEAAAEPTQDEGNALAPDMRAAVELGFFATSKSAQRSRLTLSPIFTLGVGLTDAIEIGASWGLNFQRDGATDVLDGESALALGNPLLWVARHSQSGKTLLTFGGGAALPVAATPNGADLPIALSAYQHASAIRGDWNQWLWTPEHAAFVVNFAGHAVLDELLFGGEGAIAMIVPIDTVGQAAFAGQLAAEVGYATDDVRVVMRAQAVATITPAVDDPLQFSIDPYVAWNTSDSLTLTGRFTVNLDSPTGFDGLRIWGLRLGANVNL